MLKRLAFPFRFDGRLRRSTTWIIVLTATGVLFLLAAASTAAPPGGALNEPMALVFGLSWLVWIWVAFAALVRRAHDRSRHGSFSLLALLPFTAPWVLVELGFFDSDPATNAYGVPPKGKVTPKVPHFLYNSLPVEPLL